MSKKFEVLENTICGGWVNTWHEYDDDNNEIPMRFDSFEEAVEELDNYLDDYEKAYKIGDIESPEDRNNFRIVEVKMRKFAVTMARAETRVWVYEIEAEDEDEAKNRAEQYFEEEDWDTGKAVHAEEFENGIEELKEVV
jgi:hypothetical protein